MISNVQFKKLNTTFLAICMASPFLLLALWNLWTPYSYWFDELYSVIASTGTWYFVIDSLLHDVHPPLYQFILKVWIDIFGNGEIQTRLLSLLLAFASFGAFVNALRGRRLIFKILVSMFFASSSLFAYYAQEARGYSLLLFLATVATIQDLSRINGGYERHRLRWYSTLLGLSLVHYFGLFLACMLLIGDTIRQIERRAVMERACLCVLMLVWPAIHLSIGTIGDMMGGNHWITSNGIGTTVRMFSEAVFAVPISLMDQMETANEILWIVFVVLNSTILVLMIGPPIINASGATRREMGALIFRIFLFIFIVSVIDHHTPISWPRYYIVLLPAVSLYFGYAVQFWWEYCSNVIYKTIICLSLISYFVASGIHTYNGMLIRWGSDKGWRGLAEVVNGSGVCQPHCWFYNEDSRLNLYEYYFRPSMGDQPQLTILPLEKLLRLSYNDQLPIVAAHIRPDHISKLREHYSDWQCIEPPHVSQTPVILLAPKSYSMEGLRRCP